MKKHLLISLLSTSLLLNSFAAWAQLTSGNPMLPERSSAQTQTLEEQQRTQWRNSNFGDPVRHLANMNTQAIQPFGAQLFQGGFSGDRSDGLNPEYRILPGDQITLRTWGAVEMERILPVDAQGNLFLPSIGPVQVQGMNADQLNNRIQTAIRSIYPENVHIYTNLQGIQPVSVFVTGYVALRI